MNKNYSDTFYAKLQRTVKPLLLSAMICMMAALTVNAQTPAYYNQVPAAGGNSFPFSTSQKGVQWLVDASEFALPSAAPSNNNITEVWFYLTANASIATYTTFEIKLGQISGVANAAWTPTTMYTGSMTSVFSAATFTIPVSATTRWVPITLTTPFLYDPSQALIVQVTQCGAVNGMTINQNTMVTTPRRKYLTPVSCVQAWTGQDATLPGIGLTLVPSTPCTGMPVPGNTLSTANPVCPATNFTLSTQFGGTLGSGVTYQWLSSPNGSTWTSIIGATNSTYTTTQSTATYYYCLVTCTNSSQSAFSTSLLVGSQSGAACLNYCASSATTTADEEIWNVSIAALNNSSVCGTLAPGPGSVPYEYSNYKTLPPTTLVPLVPYTMSLTLAYCGTGTFSNMAAVYIDFNQNGSFTDLGENVYTKPYGTVTFPSQVVSFPVTVPVTATTGVTGMRIVFAEASTISPCGTYSWGETEDYLVDIAALTPCTGTPAPGNTQSSANNICPFTPFTLSLQNIATLGGGITYQWQSSPNGSTWTNISGATLPSYSPSISASTWYQCIVTCTNSSLSNNSNPLQIVVNGTPLSGIYTINSAVATGGTNYQTFTDFVADLVCKGVSGPVTANVNALSGPYTERITIPAIGGASAANTITINGNGRTIQFASTASPNYSVIEFSGADFFTINNLVISQTSTTLSSFALHLWNASDNNTFSGCTMMSPANGTLTMVPFSISGSQTSATTSGTPVSVNNVVTGCTIKNGYYNVALVGNSAIPTAMTGNQIIGCNIQDQYVYGMYNLYHSGTVISGNIIERPTRTTLSTFYGCYVSSGVTNLLFEKNRIRNPFGAAITNTGAAYGVYDIIAASLGNENKFYNNLITDFNCNGQIIGLYMTGGSYYKAYHNTIVFNQAASTYASTIYCIYASGTAGIDIRNNIVFQSRGGAGIKYCLYYLAITGKISNNNDLYYSAVAGTNYIGYNGVSSYTTLPLWQAASGTFDLLSQSVDPAFINPGAGDYTPGVAAVAINDIGANVGVLTDILGASRNVATPDPGAYEFSVVACTNPPTPGAAVSSAGNVCAGVTFILSLSGATSGSGQTYQWQSSPNNVTWTNIPGANASGYSTNQAASTYYQCILTCGTSATSTSVLVTTPPLFSGTYTINSAVATGGSNFQTFTAAASAMACGINGPVVFNVVPGSGPYTEQIIAPAVFGTSAVNTITVNGNGNTLQYNSTNAALPSVLELGGLDYLTVNNLIISQTSSTISAFAVHLWNGSDNNSFIGCTIMTPANGTLTNIPFSISESQTSATTTGAPVSINNKLDGCTVKNGYYNIVLYGNSAAPTTMTGTQILNCSIQDQYVYGIYSLYSRGTIISGNTIERPTRTTLSTFYGIYLSSGMDGLLVEKNRIRKPFATDQANTNSAYLVYSFVTGTVGFENKFYNNLISDINSNGFVYCMYLSSANYTNVYHNTIAVDHLASTSASSIYGIYNTGGITNTNIRNNIIHITRGGTVAKYNLYLSSNPTTCNNNDLYIGNPSATNYIGYSALTGAVTTLSAFQASGYDLNSVSVDPVYTDAPAGDYQPTVAAVDNIGAPLGITTDINGTPRSATTPDPGAYEFILSATDLGANTLVTPAVDECYTSAQTVVVRIKNKGIATLDFSVNPATVTCNVTGMATASLSASINSGTLAVGATMDVTMSSTFDMSTLGTYNFAISATVTGDGNTLNDGIASVSRTKQFNGGSISSPVTDVCYSSPPTTINLGGAVGGNIQWQMSPTGSVPWTNVGTGADSYSPPNSNGTNYYRVVYTCEALSATSNSLLITINNPQIINSTGATRCGSGTVDLYATPSGINDVKWYDVPTGGTSLYTGSPFTTPIISSTTNYYAAAVSGGGASATAPLPPHLSAYIAAQARGMWFTAPTNFTITGLKVPDVAGGAAGMTGTTQNLAVLLMSGPVAAFPATTPFTILYLTQNNPATGVIPVNITVNVGDVIGILGTRTQTLGTDQTSYGPTGVQSTTIAGFTIPLTRFLMQVALSNAPVTLPAGVSSEVGGNLGRIEMTYATGCEGARQLVTATVNPAPSQINVTSSSSLVCVGTSATVSVSSSPANPNYTYTWTSTPAGFTATGPGPHTVIPSGTGTTYNVYAFDPTNNCGDYESTTITTLVNPITLVTTATPAAVCPGGSTQLNAIASAGGASSYCIPVYSSYDGTDYVSNVTLNTINNTTGSTALPGYVDYTSTISTTLAAGTNYTIFVTDGSFSSGENMAAWIDYNQNNVFDPAEQILPNSVTSIAFQTFSATFTVPAGAMNGATRLRVVDMYSVATNPCATGSSFGETEDYQIVITGGIPNNNVTFTYLWSPSTYLNDPTIANPVATNVTSAVTYSVVVSIPSSGCSSSSTANFTMNPPPQPSAFNSSPVCDGSSLSFFGNNTASGQTSGNTYSWTNPNNVVFSASQNPFIGVSNLNSSGVYTLTVTNSFGCTETATTSVIINPNPVLSIASQTNASCPSFTDGCVDIDATSGTMPYLFDLQGNSTLDGNYCGLGAGSYTASVIDDNGCEASQVTVTITDLDVTPPQIVQTAIDRIVQCDGAGNAADWYDWLITNWGDADATDNCTDQVILDNYWVNTYNPGNWVTDCGSTQHINVGFAVYDLYGNYSDTTYATFYIVDTLPPVFTFTPPVVTVSADAGMCSASAVILGNATASDGCSGSAVTMINNAPSAFPVGNTTVTWTATDQCGNSQTSTQIVVVTDNENPTIACPANVTVNNTPNLCAGIATWIAPVGTDNCSGAITAQTGGLASGSSFPVGTSPITYTVTDAASHTVTCSFNVTVVDNQNPAITCPANITINNTPNLCTGIATWIAPVGTDNCSGAITAQTGGLASGSSFPVGTSPVTYTVTDAASHTATCSFNVVVSDNQNPTIICPPTVTVNSNPGVCYATNIALGNPSYGDNCGGILTIANNAPVQYPVGGTFVQWEVTDLSANKASCNQLVIVQDHENPVALCKNICVYLNSAGAATITGADIDNGSHDNCGIASLAASKTSFTYADAGANTVTLTVTDINGNISTCTSIVTVGEYFTLFGSDNNCTPSPGGAANCLVNISNGSSVTGNVGSYRLVQTGGAVTINGKVVSGGKVDFANNVTSGSVSAANLLGVPGNIFTTGSAAHILGDINVSGNINVNQNAGSTVTGTVRHPAGTTYTGPVPGGGVLIAAPVLPALPGMPTIHTYTCGGANINGSAVLNPGSYGNLVLGNAAGVVVTFHGPGNYYFSNINLSQGGIHTFKYDFMGLPGNINIYVCSAIHLGQIATQWAGPNTPDACRVYIEVQGNGVNVIGLGSQFYGRMWSPYSGIDVGGGSCCTYITGSLWSAKKVNLNGAVTVVGCNSPCAPGPKIGGEISSTDNMRDMLQVYPNPTSGKTTVKFFSETSYDYTLKVIDYLGRVVLSNESKAIVGDNTLEVDLSQFAKGLYMIEIGNNDYSQKAKVVVQ